MNKFAIIAILAAGLTSAVAFADPAASAPVPTETDYVSQLPTPNDLMNKGSPDGGRVAMITQTQDGVTVTYSLPNGETRVVAYRLLPSAGSTATIGSTPPAPTVVTASAPAPVYSDTGTPYTVVYNQPAAVYYYPANYGYYYPWYWPVSVNFGWGWGWGHGWGYRGGWGGGWRGGWRR